MVYYYAKFFSWLVTSPRLVYLPMIVVLIAVMSMRYGALREASTIVEVAYTEKRTFNQALRALDIDPREYPAPYQITARPGKNIIVISLESFEQGYMGSNFNELTPNLNRLANDWTLFKNMRENGGSSWTSGSLYAQQVGMPAYFGIEGNRIFHNVTGTRLTGLGHVLQRAGYQTSYLVGKPEFAGMADLLRVYGLSVTPTSASEDATPVKTWELHDLDLFANAKSEVLRLKRHDAPFALFLSTISTHSPDGIFDPRLEGVVPTQPTNLEFMVAGVDHMIGDFVSFLRSENLLESTAIFIFPDHNLMNPIGRVAVNLSKEPRRLFLLSNIAPEILKKSRSSQIMQIEIPRLIIDGAGITSNAKFLADFFRGRNLEGLIENRKADLTSLNIAAIDFDFFRWRSSINRGVRSEAAVGRKRDAIGVARDAVDRTKFIAHAGGEIDGNIYTNSLEALDLSYQRGFRLFELDIIETSDRHFVAAHDWAHWAKLSGYPGDLPPSRQIFLNRLLDFKYTAMDMALINDWFSRHPDAILVTDKVNKPARFAAEFIDKNRLMMELFTWEAVHEGIEVGIRTPMPNGKLIVKLKGNKLEQLLNMKISAIAVSYRIAEKNNALFRSFNKSGIRTFVFHVNFDPGKDESYVVCNVMEYVYGLYADRWKFEKSFSC